MARIGVIGATGNAGSAIVEEASGRGHEVIALVRNSAKAQELLGEDISILERDAFDLSPEDLASLDVVVDAFATSPDQAYQHVDLAAQLVRFFRGSSSPRLFFILGAGSLQTGEDGHLAVEDLEALPDSASWVSIPQNQLKELKFLRDVDEVQWVGISPGLTFQAGEVKPLIQGKDTLLFNESGESVTSSGTLARAIVDEIESPQHVNERFTVIDAA